jgi:hypothetical protein
MRVLGDAAARVGVRGLELSHRRYRSAYHHRQRFVHGQWGSDAPATLDIRDDYRRLEHHLLP